MTLLEYCRSEGVAMGGRHEWPGLHIGFTTNEDIAIRCKTAGAGMHSCYNRSGPRGWEITIPLVDPETGEAVQAARELVS